MEQFVNRSSVMGARSSPGPPHANSVAVPCSFCDCIGVSAISDQEPDKFAPAPLLDEPRGLTHKSEKLKRAKDVAVGDMPEDLAGAAARKSSHPRPSSPLEGMSCCHHCCCFCA